MRLPVTFYQPGGANHVFLAPYRLWLSSQALTNNTLKSYFSRVRQFLIFVEYAAKGLELITDCDSMQEHGLLYLKFLKQHKSRLATINATIDALNSFSRFLGFEGQLFERARGYVKPAKALSAREQGQFLKSVEREKSTRDKALALVLFYSGLRIGDCARLNLENLGPGCGCLVLNDSVRLQLDHRTSASLTQYMEERQQSPTAPAENALWVTDKGRRLSVSGITFVIKRIGWQAGLKLSSETLRRTWLAAAGNSMNSDELATKFGGYISAKTMQRHTRKHAP